MLFRSERLQAESDKERQTTVVLKAENDESDVPESVETKESPEEGKTEA